MKKLIVLAALATLLAGCAGTWETRANNALGIACDGYATVLDQITPHKADLSMENVKRVDSANTLVDKACLPGSGIDPEDAISTVREGIDLLKNIKESF